MYFTFFLLFIECVVDFCRDSTMSLKQAQPSFYKIVGNFACNICNIRYKVYRSLHLLSLLPVILLQGKVYLGIAETPVITVYNQVHLEVPEAFPVCLFGATRPGRKANPRCFSLYSHEKTTSVFCTSIWKVQTNRAFHTVFVRLLCRPNEKYDSRYPLVLYLSRTSIGLLIFPHGESSNRLCVATHTPRGVN